MSVVRNWSIEIMYPNLRLSFHEDNKNTSNIAFENQYEYGGYPKLEMSLAELRQIVQSNIHTYDPKQYKFIDKFLQDEQVYVDKLAVLEVQKFDLGLIKIPYYDLQSIFGYIEEIKNIHEKIFPQDLIRIYSIEDILRVFVKHGEKLRIYIKDEWKKSQVKFEGKQAILKRFYNKGIIKDLSLPEQKISDYLKFHEQIKSNYEHIKSSEIFQQSFELFNNIYIQMQYVKQAAVIEKFQMPLFQNIHLVNLFYVSMDGGLATRYKVFFMDNDLVFTSLGSLTKPQKAEMKIRTDTISLNASIRDDVSFEMYQHCEKNQKKAYLFVAENSYVRNEWMQIINKALYRQMVVVKQRVKSSSEESTNSYS